MRRRPEGAVEDGERAAASLPGMAAAAGDHVGNRLFFAGDDLGDIQRVVFHAAVKVKHIGVCQAEEG